MFLSEIKLSEPDPIFSIAKDYQEDDRPNKVNLTLGIYKNKDLQSELMDAVVKAKKKVEEGDQRATYLPLDGSRSFLDALAELIFGKDLYASSQSQIYSAQTIGGTGALRIGADFLFANVSKKIAIPSPSWANHQSVFEQAGLDVVRYNYYDPKILGLNFEKMIDSIRKLPEKTVLLLHPCCHNPTGSDLSQEQWRLLSELMLERQLLPFFDCAYQGIGDGLEEDAFAVRYFLEKGHEMFVAYTCSKNFSLYCHRVGALYIVAKQSQFCEEIGSQIKYLIRRNYSNPPNFGQLIASEVLTNPNLKSSWEKQLNEMKNRLKNVRKDLQNALVSQNTKLDYTFLTAQKGMFSFSGLTAEQVMQLRKKYAIYMPASGRLCMSGLNSNNIDYVAEAIAKVQV